MLYFYDTKMYLYIIYDMLKCDDEEYLRKEQQPSWGGAEVQMSINY